jgi:hypothetical protein
MALYDRAIRRLRVVLGALWAQQQRAVVALLADPVRASDFRLGQDDPDVQLSHDSMSHVPGWKLRLLDPPGPT